MESRKEEDPDRPQLRSAPKPRSWLPPPANSQTLPNDLTGRGLFLIREQGRGRHGLTRLS